MNSRFRRGIACEWIESGQLARNKYVHGWRDFWDLMLFDSYDILVKCRRSFSRAISPSLGAVCNSCKESFAQSLGQRHEWVMLKGRV